MIRLNRSILVICLLALIPSTVLISHAVQEVTVSRDSYSEDNYLLFEDHNGVDQFWIDHNGTAYHNGTQIEADIHNILNVTSTGCANDEILKVSSGIWGCATESGGGGGGPNIIVKQSDETVNNTTVLQDDDELFFTYDADSWYRFTTIIWYNTDTTPDIKISCRSTTSHVEEFTWPDYDGGSGFSEFTCGQTWTFTGITGFERFAFYHGYFLSTSSGGTHYIEWAQNTADASDTTVKAGSILYYEKVDP